MALDHLPTSATAPADIIELTSIFQLLADPTRLRVILQILKRGECNVTALCRDLTLPQPTVSHHLGLLRGGRLVECRRQGKHIYYKVPHRRINKKNEHELCIELSRHGIHVFSNGTGRQGLRGTRGVGDVETGRIT